MIKKKIHTERKFEGDVGQEGGGVTRIRVLTHDTKHFSSVFRRIPLESVLHHVWTATLAVSVLQSLCSKRMQDA